MKPGPLEPSVEDRLALRDLIDRYARTVDDRDGQGFVELFEPEAELTILFSGETLAVFSGHEGLPGAVAPIEQYETTLHVMANHLVETDGSTVTGEVWCLAHHVTRKGDEAEDLVMAIRYRDVYSPSASGWRFANRVVDIQWTETRPASLQPLVF